MPHRLLLLKLIEIDLRASPFRSTPSTGPGDNGGRLDQFIEPNFLRSSAITPGSPAPASAQFHLRDPDRSSHASIISAHVAEHCVIAAIRRTAATGPSQSCA
jgi:hypothetical protein